MAKRTIEQAEVTSRRVLMRVDFNVPLDAGGSITDDRRIRAALPSIRSVIDRGGRLVLMSHLGRPKGKGFEPKFSLRPAADRLRELLAGPVVHFAADDCVGPEAKRLVETMRDGEIVLLENLRFHAAEKGGDEAFAAELAATADVYCNDAFGTAHRDHASMLAVPRAMSGRPRVAGLLLAKELAYLADAIANAERPFVAVLGGAKVSDKLGAIENLTQRVDHILIGGAMAYTFLRGRGEAVGASLVEEEMLDTARAILEGTPATGVEIDLPTDHACGREIAPGTPVQIFRGPIEEGWIGLDIGAETATRFAAKLREARTIVWNGPVGVFETPPFDAGTRTVADAIVSATAGGAVSVIGGGDSAAAVEAFGLSDQVSHVSTGGGASLRMLEGRPFPSVEILD